MIGDHLAAYTFEYLLEQGLAEIRDTVDKREGSVVYDAVAVSARKAADCFTEMRQIYQDTFAQYSSGEALGLRTEENGVLRKTAAKAIRKGVFIGKDDQPYSPAIGSRFSTVAGAASQVFRVIEATDEPGSYRLEAEAAGNAGNDYLGQLLPVDVQFNLKSAQLADILVPGDDAEEDDSLRSRYFEEKNTKKFGGNISQYRDWLISLNGVGACQIYPTWDGPGTVLVSAVDRQNQPLSPEYLDEVQQLIDPTQDGQGLGTAPIGHEVTVTTPTIKSIDVSATVQVATGFTLEQLQPLIEAEVEAYIADARIDWGQPASADDNDYSLYVFASQIMAAMLRVKGVQNVTGLLLNGAAGDVELSETAAIQELPLLGVVELV